MFFPILNLGVEDRTDHGILTNVSVEMVQQIRDPLVAADKLVKRVHDSSDSTRRLGMSGARTLEWRILGLTWDAVFEGS